MNPWELLLIMLGWCAVGIVAILMITVLCIVIGVLVGLARGHGTHTIMKSRKTRKRDRDG